MNTEDNIGKGSLGQKMKDFSVTPPDKVWEGVAAHLDSGGGKGRILFWLAIAAGIVLAVSVGLNLNWYLGGKQPDTELAVQETPVEEGIITSKPSVNFDQHSGLKKEEQDAGPILQNEAKTEATVRVIEIETAHVHAVESKDAAVVNDLPLPVYSDENVELALAEPQSDDSNPDTEVSDEATFSGDPLAGLQDTPGADSTVIQSVMPLQLPDPGPLLAENDPKERNWSVTAALSPLYSYRDAQGTLATNTFLNSNESALLSYAGGIRVAFEAIAGLELETGLVFNKMGLVIGDVDNYSLDASWRGYVSLSSVDSRKSVYMSTNTIGNIVTVAGDQVLNNYGGEVSGTFDYVNEPQSESIEESPADALHQYMEYVEIPFNLKYKFFDKAFALRLIGGFSTNILVGNHVDRMSADGLVSFGYVEDVRSVNYSGNAGLGMTYHIGENIDLNVEPRFRYFLNSVNQEDIPTTRPYSFGLFTGISYLF